MGCNEIKKNIFTLERDGNLKIYSVSDIVKLYKDSFDKKVILYRLHISEEAENLDKIYRVVFPFKLVKKEIYGSHTFGSQVSIDLCENKIITASSPDEFQLEAVLGKVDVSQELGKYYTLNLSLDRLKSKGLVSENKSKQKDICIYFNESMHLSVGSHVKSESNVIKFTADEINTIRAEYERLTQ